LKVEGGKIKYLDSQTCFYNVKKTFLERVPEIFQTSQEIFRKINPDIVALESLIFVKNPSSLAKLSQARGIILAAKEDYERCEINEFSPNSIKQATTGHGHADKKVLQHWLNKILGARTYQSDDESDALCIAFCQAMHLNINKDLLPNKSRGGNRGRSLSRSLEHLVK
jgi:crossover junction endodeoxyribonuclease RuvC